MAVVVTDLGTHVVTARPRLSLTVRRRSGQMVISVRGEVDASNAKEFALGVCDAALRSRTLTLDLTRIDFMALDGLSALHAVNARLAARDTVWAVVPGAAVLRVLELGDPEQLIPRASGQRLHPGHAKPA